MSYRTIGSYTISARRGEVLLTDESPLMYTNLTPGMARRLGEALILAADAADGDRFRQTRLLQPGEPSCMCGGARWDGPDDTNKENR